MRVEKSRNVFQGVGKGLKSAGMGVFEGVTGLVMQPLKGAKKGGLVGFLKGIGKGVVGLVAKPLTGLFDFASHTTEGLKNTVTYFDDRANELKVRKPRAFYGRDKYFKRYLEYEATLMNNLKIFEEGKYAFDSFIDSWQLSEGLKGFILIMTFEHLLYVNTQANKIVFVVEPDCITSLEKEKTGIKVISSQNAQTREQMIPCHNKILIKDMLDTINEVRYTSLGINLQIM